MAQKAIVFTGVEQTIKDLKKFDTQAVAKFNKVINDELRKAKTDAKTIVVASVLDNDAPLSHWQTQAKIGARTEKQSKAGRPWPAWNTGEVVAGIKSSRAQGKVRSDYTTSVGALINGSRAGAIFEIAGRKPGGGKNASGKAFIDALNTKYGEASRVVWRVVDRDRVKIEAAFGRALEEAKQTLQRALESR